MVDFHFTVYVKNSKCRSVIYKDATDAERAFVQQLEMFYENSFKNHEDENVNGLIRVCSIESPLMEFEEIPDKYKDGIIGITIDYASRF